MTSRSKRKKSKAITTITFGEGSGGRASSTPGSSSAARDVVGRGLLVEKTSIRQDGTTRQDRSIMGVSSGDKWLPANVRPDEAKLPQPIYESYSAADHGGEEYGDDDEEGGRELRESDDPLHQWAQDHRETYLAEMLRHEGCGDFAEYALCPRCSTAKAEHRCHNCLGGGELLCQSCIVAAHQQLPFHTIHRWTGFRFERITLKDLGLRIQLGHWHGPNRAICPCLKPQPGTISSSLTTAASIRSIWTTACVGRLLRARLWAATTTNPRTAASFSVLRRYHLLSFESKCAALEFYQSLAREGDNLHYKKDKDRYHEFLRMTRQWRNIRMLKRAGRGHDPAGIVGTKPGECALLCPACPQLGINLPPNWKEAAEEKQFLYTLFVALDANFHLKRKDVSSEERDPGLGNGWAFYCDVVNYMEHVKKHWDDKQERSHCVAHDAVDKPDREARGTASSGIGAVDCARHNMKQPSAVGDLQLGERTARCGLLRFFVSYDIACQWHLNIRTRMAKYQDATLTLDGRKVVTYLVPKFHLPAHIEACNLKYSFNLTRYVGQTDGEAPERGWANANPLARSTKEMGPGFRRDTLDDHFNDWNHKKIIALGYAMRKKVEKAVPEMVETRRALSDLNESVASAVVKGWTEMAEKWEDDPTAPNPFETLRKDQHVAKVRAELAAEAAAREAAGNEEEDAVRGDMHVTELIAMGLQLEDQQRVLGADIAATGLHPTDGQRRAMTERTSKLRRKIFAWIDIQHRFFPALANIRAREDEARARLAQGQSVPGVMVSNIKLWLPSAVGAAPGPDRLSVRMQKSISMHEYRLRVGQAAEALHDVRRQLLVRTHLYHLKDQYERGIRANMRSGDKIAALNDQIKRAAAQYRVARNTLVTLGKELNRDEWEWTFRHLAEEDVRGLPRAQFHDPERKKKKSKQRKRMAKNKEPREMSWIWVARGQDATPGTKTAMDEAVRIEWAKTRARAMRWAEEVDLLEEEMRRIDQFLRWRSDWWLGRVGLRGLAEGPQREGETAYATRQAAIQATLAKEFRNEWEGLDDLIKNGRAGVVAGEAESDVEEDEDDEEDDSGEEEEPVPISQKTVKPTYVDEVLDM
ncbi:hypothetical protein B0H14DRAFT_2625671 [Mycena olivaceomarginata]|nr:hypothetical protein B0H14DRAFT_2625671 [Mycena olivaceomarginata]